MTKSAIFSDDKTHRFVLTRVWNDTLPKAMCIGLNPSSANDEKDDSTIRYLIKVLTALGYGGLNMVNLFSYVTSNPQNLLDSHFNTQFPHLANESWITASAKDSQSIIFCWGDFSQAYCKAREIKKMFPSALWEIKKGQSIPPPAARQVRCSSGNCHNQNILIHHERLSTILL